MSAVLVLVVGFAIYIGFKKFPQGKDAVNSENINDTDKSIDTLTQSQQNGKKLFMSMCASCHAIFKDMTGNAMAGVEARWPMKKELFAFIRNPFEAMAKNSKLRKLKEKYGSMMTAFPNLTDKEIQDILNYIKSQEQAQKNGIP
jgi:cytochrome c1